MGVDLYIVPLDDGMDRIPIALDRQFVLHNAVRECPSIVPDPVVDLNWLGNQQPGWDWPSPEKCVRADNLADAMQNTGEVLTDWNAAVLALLRALPPDHPVAISWDY